MEQKKETPQPNNTPPPDQKPADTGQSSGPKVLKDEGSGLGWRSHVNTAPPKQTSRRSKILKPRFLVPIALILILLLVGGVLVFLSQRKPVSDEGKAGISLQGLGGDAVKSLTQAFNGGSKQVLTVNADTVFQNQVTFEDDTNFKGQISGDQGINVNGAATFDTVNIRSNLTVSGATKLQGQIEIANQLNVNGALFVNASGTFAGGLSVSNNLNVGGNLTVVGSLEIGTIGTQNITVGNTLTVNGHLETGGGTPSIIATGFIGNGGTVRLSGNDTAGTIVVATGTNPSPGQLATINFSRSFSGVPKVLITPVGMNAARLQFFTTRTASNFTFNSNTDPVNSTEYAYDYFVID
jgi:hypothetical protein